MNMKSANTFRPGRQIALLLALPVVLAGCQTMGPEPGEGRSIYSGQHSVLYRARQQAGSLEQALQLADMAYQAGDLDQALFQYLRALELQPAAARPLAESLEGSASPGVCRQSGR